MHLQQALLKSNSCQGIYEHIKPYDIINIILKGLEMLHQIGLYYIYHNSMSRTTQRKD